MRPQIACTNCKLRKKKCNRAYPACSYCLKTHDRCAYVSGKNTFSSRGKFQIETPIYQNVSHESEPTPWSQPVFLENDLLNVRDRSETGTSLVVDTALRLELERDSNQEECCKRYLEVFSHWISVIPPKQISTTFSAPTATLAGADMILLACIRLHAVEFADSDPRTKRYVGVKSSLAGAEIQSTLSIKLLQAQILVLLYEFGHGIYPSAYLTLGRCVSYLAALRIDEDVPDSRGGITWIETELHRRLWWAVFVMERCIAIGDPGRALLIPEPTRSRALPSDDESWERGHQTAHDQPHATLATPLDSGMGNFRLLVLSSHLLGQVIRTISDLDIERRPHQEMVLQLYRTMTAFQNVIEEEAQMEVMFVNGVRGVLNSTIMLLFSNKNLDLRQAIPESPVAISATLFLDRSRSFLQRQPPSVRQASPFLLHWGYYALDYFYSEYGKSGRLEDRQAIEDIEETFHKLENRWRLASVYTGIICRRYVNGLG